MAWSRTLTELIADARARADMEVGVFVAPTVITNWINLAITELLELVANQADELWNAGITVAPPAQTTPGVDLYNLAANVFKPIGVEVSFDGGTKWRSCKRFPFAERNNEFAPNGRVPRYAFVGSKIMFRPVPQGAITFRYWYLPAATPLVAGSDAYDFVNGWDDWVACRVAIRCLQKEESDTGPLERDLREIKARIIDGCRVRDQGEPIRIADVRGMLRHRSDDEEAW